MVSGPCTALLFQKIKPASHCSWLAGFALSAGANASLNTTASGATPSSRSAAAALLAWSHEGISLMSQAESPTVETDPRFPSGPWTGYFLQHRSKGMMELHITFRQGALTGEGRDYVGRFVLRGRYE